MTEGNVLDFLRAADAPPPISSQTPVHPGEAGRSRGCWVSDFSLLLRTALLPVFFALSTGCGPKAALEPALEKQKGGDHEAAAAGFQAYLNSHPSSVLAPEAAYRLGLSLEALGRLQEALAAYQKALELSAEEGDAAREALLALGRLHEEKLKNPEKAAVYYEKALARTVQHGPVRKAVQGVVEAKARSATALFSANDPEAAALAKSVLETYPASFLTPDQRARLEALADRGRRAQMIRQSEPERLYVRQEIPFTNSFEGDFEESFTVDKGRVPSPDGSLLALIRKTADGRSYLYVGKIDSGSSAVTYRLVPGSTGAAEPIWSPDGRQIAYFREVGQTRHLERVDAATLRRESLYYTGSPTLGLHPAFSPWGDKIAFVYEGNVWVVKADGTHKALLRTNQKLDKTARLQWSRDGTLIRYRQKSPDGKLVDGLLVLDVFDGEAL